MFHVLHTHMWCSDAIYHVPENVNRSAHNGVRELGWETYVSLRVLLDCLSWCRPGPMIGMSCSETDEDEESEAGMEMHG